MSELLLLGTSHKTAPLARARARRAARRARGAVPARARRAPGDPRGGRALDLQPHRAIRRRERPGRGRDDRARDARPPGRAAPDRADRRHLLASQLRRRAPPLPRDERARVDDRRRGRGAGPGQARLRGGARRAHDRAADEQAVPRRAGDRQARADRHRDRRRRRERRLRRGRGRARRAGRAGEPPRADHRRGRDRGADGAGAVRAGRLDDLRRQPAARAGDRAGAPFGGSTISFDALPGELERADIVVASTASPHAIVGAEELALVTRRAAAGRCCCSTSPCRATSTPTARRCRASRWSTSTGCRRRSRARTPSAGSRRAAPRASSRRRSRASPAGSGSLEVLPTIAALREQADRLVAELLAENEHALGERSASATASASRRCCARRSSGCCTSRRSA